MTPGNILENFELKFQDNFDVTSNNAPESADSLVSGRWDSQLPWGPYVQANNETQIYIDQLGRHRGHDLAPLSLATDQKGNGYLRITAREVDPAELPKQPALTDAEWLLYPTNQPNPAYNTSAGWVPGMASGLINSYNSFNFVNGYVEIRAKLPGGAGLLPALRLMGSNTLNSPTSLDISLSQDAYANEFHTYAVEWDKERVQWYVDGDVVEVLTGDEVPAEAMYVLVNLAMGPEFMEGEGQSTVRSELLIDYIRVYQRKHGSRNTSRATETLYIEAESAILQGAMVIGNDAAATAGAFVHVPVGTGDGDACIDFVFDVAEEGLYTLEAAVYAESEEQNSFFFSVDGGSRRSFSFPVSPTYTARPVSTRADGTVALQLSAGKHTVRLTRRENGARIDWMRLLKVPAGGDQDADGFANEVDAFPLDPAEWTDSDNDGLGNFADPTPYGDARPLYAEAEVATLSGAMTVDLDVNAEGGAYVSSPIGSTVTGEDYVEFEFKINQAGIYRLEGSVLAFDGRTDSFFVSVNDGPVITWSFPGTGDYLTEIVRDQGLGERNFLLEPGVATVRVSRRESGARLDWLRLVPTSTALDVDGDGIANSRDAFPTDFLEWTDSDGDGVGNNTDLSPYGDITPFLAEAELATIRGQMVPVGDDQASNGGYVTVPEGTGSSNFRSDLVEFEFRAPAAGQYKLQASVYATDGMDDSFFVSVNGSELTLWEVPARSEYVVDLVSNQADGDLSVELNAGFNLIQVVRREEGARLDWLRIVPGLTGLN